MRLVLGKSGQPYLKMTITTKKSDFDKLSFNFPKPISLLHVTPSHSAETICQDELAMMFNSKNEQIVSI
jgi:hypothetical protein